MPVFSTGLRSVASVQSGLAALRKRRPSPEGSPAPAAPQPRYNREAPATGRGARDGEGRPAPRRMVNHAGQPDLQRRRDSDPPRKTVSVPNGPKLRLQCGGFPGLKGPNPSAQGNALGHGSVPGTSPVRAAQWLFSTDLCRPYRAWCVCNRRNPRALPWALGLQPFRLKGLANSQRKRNATFPEHFGCP